MNNLDDLDIEYENWYLFFSLSCFYEYYPIISNQNSGLMEFLLFVFNQICFFLCLKSIEIYLKKSSFGIYLVFVFFCFKFFLRKIWKENFSFFFLFHRHQFFVFVSLHFFFCLFLSLSLFISNSVIAIALMDRFW